MLTRFGRARVALPAEPQPGPRARDEATAGHVAAAGGGKGAQRTSVRRLRAVNRVLVAAVVALALAAAVHRANQAYPALLGAPVGVLVEEESRPGLHFNASDVVCRRTFVAVPGFVTTALEVWDELPCATSAFATNFRKPLFGASMLLTLLEDPECFFRHAALDPETAGDPPGVKLRPAAGLSAIDYVAPGFWVWAKVFRNLADVGYSPHDIVAAAFDWRLSPAELAAVGFFEELKEDVERALRRAQRRWERGSDDATLTREAWEAEGCGRAVLAAHSYGTSIVNAFLSWADASEPGWASRHVHAVVHIGGPTLGMPKAAAALLTGEFRDVAVLPAPMRAMVDRSLPRRLRTWTFRTWPCLWALWPQGGDAAWRPIATLYNATGGSDPVALDWRRLAALAADAAAASGNHLLERRARSIADGTRSAAPEAPPMPPAAAATVYCFYGVNRPTEVGYSYREAASGTLEIDADRADFGVTLGNGDGTVPLLSLGYGCRSNAPGSWRQRAARVVTREFDDVDGPRLQAEVADDPTAAALNAERKLAEQAHEASLLSGLTGGAREAMGLWDELRTGSIVGRLERIGVPDPRGGVATSDHVDIMGNHELIAALLTISTAAVGATHAALPDRVVSRIDALVEAADGAVSPTARRR